MESVSGGICWHHFVGDVGLHEIVRFFGDLWEGQAVKQPDGTDDDGAKTVGLPRQATYATVSPEHGSHRDRSRPDPCVA